MPKSGQQSLSQTRRNREVWQFMLKREPIERKKKLTCPGMYRAKTAIAILRYNEKINRLKIKTYCGLLIISTPGFNAGSQAPFLIPFPVPL